MNIVDEIKKLEAFHLIVGILGFVSMVAPGLLSVCLFHPRLLIELDCLKLLLLSSSLTAPFLIFNFFYISVQITRKKAVSWYSGSHLLAALIVFSLNFYAVLLFSYYYAFSAKFFILALVLLNLLVLLAMSLNIFKD